MKKSTIGCIAMSCLLWIFTLSCTSDLSEHHGKLDIKLFNGDALNQPLIVGFGGSEGGNAWASEYWRDERDKFIEDGFAFMAIGYFGAPGTPNQLDRISLNAIRDSIVNIAKRHPAIDHTNITLIGGSKGGELVLNLASYFNDFNNVVAIVPSHTSFHAHTIMANTSSWMLYNEEVPFVPATWSSLPATLKRDLHSAFSIMLQDSLAVQRARIPVEKISGSILLISASNDEMWPSTLMSNYLISNLNSIGFQHRLEHIVIEGDHASPLKHFDIIHEFLREENLTKP